MEVQVKLVHPDDPDSKVVTATSDVQVEAFKSVGFVEEDALNESTKAQGASEADTSEELAKLKAENKALKTENTKLKNKLEKVSDQTTAPEDGNKPEETN